MQNTLESAAVTQSALTPARRKRRFPKKLTLFDAAVHLILGIIVLVCFLPFVYVLIVSFTDPSVYIPLEFQLFPKKFSLEVYKSILDTDTFTRSLGNTVYITLVGTVLSIFTTFTFAYGLSKKDIPLHRLFITVVLFGLLFNPGMIPEYMNIRTLGLLNSFWSLIFSGLISSWNVIIARNFIQGIPGELEEAAKIDGCSYFGIFFRIILPLSTASIATLTLFIAVSNWNQYTKPLLYLNDYKMHTLQVYLKSLLVDSDTMGMNAMESDRVLPSETIRMATVILAMLPIMCVYPFVQRYFVKGVMVGSVKG